MKSKTFDSFLRQGSYLIANRIQVNKENKLKPGLYTIGHDSQQNMTWFEEREVISDHILELPSKEYQQITQEMRDFMKPETKALFEKYGFIYKRSALLYGDPGVGKTIILTRVIKDVVKQGGVVLYVDNPTILTHIYDVLNDVDSNQFTLVVFEEFDRMTGRYESELLSILDGEVQKNNVMYLATTNYIDRIAARLRRPGRFSSVIEVKRPSLDARYAYFDFKLKDDVLSQKLAERTEGLSVDELKEVIQAHIILGQDLDQTVNKLRVNNGTSQDTSLLKEDSDDDDEEDAVEDYYQMTAALLGATPVKPPRKPEKI